MATTAKMTVTMELDADECHALIQAIHDRKTTLLRYKADGWNPSASSFQQEWQRLENLRTRFLRLRGVADGTFPRAGRKR